MKRLVAVVVLAVVLVGAAHRAMRAADLGGVGVDSSAAHATGL